MAKHATFIDNDTSAGNRVMAEWLNQANDVVYDDEVLEPTTVSNYTTFIAQVAARTGKTVVVAGGINVAIDDDYTVPADVELKMKKGATFTVASGKTLTIAAPLTAGLYQIFTGAGDVVVTNGATEKLKAAWFGAKGDNSTDDGAALKRGLKVANASVCKDLILHAGTYLSSVEIGFYTGTTDYAGVVMEGVGSSYAAGAHSSSTIIKASAAVTHLINLIRTESVARSGRCQIKNLAVDGNDLADNGINVASANVIDNVTATKTLVNGIRLGDYTNGTVIGRFNGSLNGGNGLGVYGANSTIFAVRDFSLIQNVKGLYMEGGQYFTMENGVIQSNSGIGTHLHAPTGTTGPAGGIFINLWHEDNNTADATGFEIWIDATDATSATNVPRNNKFIGGKAIVTEVTQRYINMPSARDCQFVDFGISGSTEAITASIVLSQYSTNCINVVSDETYNPSWEDALAAGTNCKEIRVSNTLGYRITGTVDTDSITMGKARHKSGVLTSGIAGVATTVYTLPAADASAKVIAMCSRQGGGHTAVDEVIITAGYATVGVQSATTLQGTPDARTWSVGGGSTTELKVLFASNTYNVRVVPLEILT